MEAGILKCPHCGAAVSVDSSQCQFCQARLATVACPSCFGMMFVGSRHCPACGVRADRMTVADLPSRSCPRCRTRMQGIALGANPLHECQGCGGLWVDAASFEHICADREQQAAVLGAASSVPASAPASGVAPVQYIPCPECGRLMNRVNFARCSGVIVDVCKQHGTWFDRDELAQIVAFIRGGGLEVARAREKASLVEERQRLRQAQRETELESRFEVREHGGRIGWGDVLGAAQGLLRLLRG